MSDNVEGESSRIVYHVQLNLNIDRDCVSDISGYCVSDTVYQIWSIAYQTSPLDSF